VTASTDLGRAHPISFLLRCAVVDDMLGERPNQVGRQRDDVSVAADDLLNVAATPGEVTEEGVRLNVSVGIQYIASLAERGRRCRDQQPDGDAATAEITAAIWQWSSTIVSPRARPQLDARNSKARPRPRGSGGELRGSGVADDSRTS